MIWISESPHNLATLETTLPVGSFNPTILFAPDFEVCEWGQLARSKQVEGPCAMPHNGNKLGNLAILCHCGMRSLGAQVSKNKAWPSVSLSRIRSAFPEDPEHMCSALMLLRMHHSKIAQLSKNQ
jgi:hypothetical protein